MTTVDEQGARPGICLISGNRLPPIMGGWKIQISG